MASNFQLFPYRNKNNLHLQLYGDFDGNSAHEVINVLKKHGADFLHIFIDTNDLSDIYPFGIDVFQKHLNTLEKQFDSFIFIGKHKHIFTS